MSKVALTELQENNLPYNLAATTSTLSPRAIRLTLLYLAVIIEVAICALFFSLAEEEEDGPEPPFWQQVIENFWVAVYTVCFAMPLLLLVGCLLGFSSRVRRSLRDAANINILETTYRKHRCCIKFR